MRKKGCGGALRPPHPFFRIFSSFLWEGAALSLAKRGQGDGERAEDVVLDFEKRKYLTAFSCP